MYPNNSTDSVSIKLGLSSADPLVKQRTNLLDALGIANNCELDVLPSPKYISAKLLGFVRVFNMNEGINLFVILSASPSNICSIFQNI